MECLEKPELPSPEFPIILANQFGHSKGKEMRALLCAVFVLALVPALMAQDSPQEIAEKAMEEHQAGNYDESIELHKKIAALGGQGAQIGNYNIGCAFSLKKETDKAFEYLDKAVDAGFLDAGHVEGDSDLANIKEDPRFAKLIARMKNGGKPVMEKEEKKGGPSIAGKWKITSGSRSGAAVGKERLTTISITDKDITMSAGPGDPFVMSYKIDATKKPFEVDMKIESGPIPSGAAKGIVMLDGNKMKLCYNPMGGERPTKFETAEGDNCFFFEMEKEAAKLTAETLVGTWSIVEGKRAGKASAAESTAVDVVFTKDSIALGEGEMGFKMSYELDVDKSPAEIDMKVTGGPAPVGSPAAGIVKLDDDGHVLLCYDGMGGPRPAKFESTEENGCFLFKLKKKE